MPTNNLFSFLVDKEDATRHDDVSLSRLKNQYNISQIKNLEFQKSHTIVVLIQLLLLRNNIRLTAESQEK